MGGVYNPHKTISIASPATSDEEWRAMRETILSGWLTQGPQIEKFERLFADMHQTSYALTTSSCTTALHLALKALGISKGDEVIVPIFTWIATANAILYCDATPIFCDIDRKTYNIKITDLKDKITHKTKAIIPVHLFGMCADIDQIRKILPDHIKIIEDAACAAGATYKNRFAGNLGDIGAFSFHPRKSITCGEGGMLTTNNKSINITAKTLRNHGCEI
ncbi:MAG: DegT/DnrJ/EryC1/StrS family aminotransferase, partial [Pseudomonadota bacterium]